MYDIYQQAFRTPRGHMVDMWLRQNTNDWNTLASCLNEDEYGLHNLQLTGRAIDIGAYLGGVTVALLEDNPGLEVVAVEPVPSNVELLRRNVEPYGDRVTVIDGAVGDGSKVNIRYGYSGSELACHHAYVGNMSLIPETATDVPHTVRQVKTRKLPSLGTFDFAKIDCEGCEWEVDLSGVPRIRGEWHPVRGHIRDELRTRLPNHDITFDGPENGPGGFEAVLR